MLLLPFQNVIPAEVSLVCVVKPDEFWDKKVTHFCFWKEKDRLGFEVSLEISSVEPCEASPHLLQTVRVQICVINMLSTNCDYNFLLVAWTWGMTMSPISWSRSNHLYELACTTCCSTSATEKVFRAASEKTGWK